MEGDMHMHINEPMIAMQAATKAVTMAMAAVPSPGRPSEASPQVEFSGREGEALNCSVTFAVR